MNCSVKGNFGDKLRLTTMVPLAFVALVLVSRGTYVAVKGTQFIGEGSSGGLKYVLMLLFFLIPTVATTVCQTFAVR